MDGAFCFPCVLFARECGRNAGRLFKTVIFCGRNNIALRGRRDDDPSNENLQGNFQALLEF